MSVLLTLFLGAVLCLCNISESKRLKVQTHRGKNYYKVPSADTLSLANSNNQFGFSLYKLLARESPEGNMLVSPFSISMALGLLALGAKGPTQTQILQGLKVKNSLKPEADIHQGFQQLLQLLNRPRTALQLNVSTTLFLDKQLGLKESFKKDAQTFYYAKAISADFQDPDAAKKFINGYVEQNSQGKIRDMVKSLDARTRMVLVNYLVFKAKWMMPFDPCNTFMSDFYVNKKRKVEVPMLRAEDIQVPYFRDTELQCMIVQLPYRDNTGFALLVLPNVDGMSNLEAALSPDTLQNWKDSLKMRKITLHLPKFSISGDYNLEQIPHKLGISKVVQNADFSGISTNGNLTLSQVRHRAVLGVAEKGTEAASAARKKKNPLPSMPTSLTVKFNRPFLVAVVSEKTQGILFLGRVYDPQQA